MAFLPQTASEAAAVLLSYLLGAAPFGLLLGFLRGVDIRQSGSGNIGATNVGRVLGRPFALVAFACDFAKGLVPSLWIGPALASESAPTVLGVLCGAAAVCGHVWPVYLKFRGGKGVATGCGAIVGIDPLIFLIGGAAWLVTLAISRFVGLSSLVMGAAFPVAAWWRSGSQDYGAEAVWGTLGLAVLILVRHRANIARMWVGTEPRIGNTASGKDSSEPG